MSKEAGKGYEALVEDYEDALMRLVMYRVAQEDGKRLLEETEDLERSGFKVPKELDEKCLALIRNARAPVERGQAPASAGACKETSSHRLRLYRLGEILVAAILAAALLFCAAYAVNEEFRINVLNFFLELQENGTWFSFSKGGTGEFGPNGTTGQAGVEDGFPFQFTYIPEGYELFKQETQDLGANGMGYYCAYFSAEDPPCEFYFDISPISEGTGLFVDTEDAVVTEMTIRGHDGWLIEKTEVTSKKEKVKYFWFDLAGKYSFLYSSLGISPEENQKIFDGIVISEQF